MILSDIIDLTNKLLKEPAYGWTDEPWLLARFMGFHDDRVLRRRLDGTIRLTIDQQKQASVALERILAGEVMCERRLFQGGIVGEIVEQAHPRRLEWKKPNRCSVRVTSTGVRLSLVPRPVQSDTSKMPSFRSLLCQS